jgi:hypothetical protein
MPIANTLLTKLKSLFQPAVVKSLPLHPIKEASPNFMEWRLDIRSTPGSFCVCQARAQVFVSKLSNFTLKTTVSCKKKKSSVYNHCIIVSNWKWCIIFSYNVYLDCTMQAIAEVIVGICTGAKQTQVGLN